MSCVYTEQTRSIATDAVLLVTSRIPRDDLYREIATSIASTNPESGPVPTLDKIGDCDAPAIIAAAVYAGHRYARELEADGIHSDVGRQDKIFVPD